MSKTDKTGSLLARKVRSYADENSLLPRGGAVIAGVSGGADSVCMMKILAELSAAYDYKLMIAHFDHRLRGAESDRDREFVRDLCADCGAELIIGYGDTREYAAAHSLGIEEAARELRYAFFSDTADKVKAAKTYAGGICIATAHNSDDNAETMLLNLARGAGPRGLAGIPPRRGDIIRPLLAVSRKEIEEYLEAEGIPNIEDSSNSDMKYARNRVRHEILPVLESINPRFLEHTTAASEILRADDEYIRSKASEYISDNCAGRSITVNELTRLPVPVAVRVIDILSGVRLSREHILAVLDISNKVSGKLSLDLPGVLVKREGKQIHFYPPKPPRKLKAVKKT